MMTMKTERKLKLGLIGCGGFGQFCLEAFSKMSEVEIFAVCDIDQKLVMETAKKYGATWYTNPENLIEDKKLDIVHIVTPPNTHFNLSSFAIQNGKHVLCEKPLALSIKGADKLLNTAKQNDVIIPVNFILRYVKIVEIVKNIIDSGILGNPLRAYFENYAADEYMGPEHWFWNKKMSGGIFVEHGVHFFDLYNFWFGNVKILWAYAEKRPASNQEDRVFCFLSHESGVLSSHYHGFDQTKYLDRQIHKILFEAGEIVVRGWIPEYITIKAICDEKKVRKLKSICPPTHFEVLEKINPSKQKMKGRGKSIDADQFILLEYRSKTSKLELYSQAIRDLLKDQIKYIKDPNHNRIIKEENGLEALKLALTAAKMD
jgi:predicted dehydrogenase